MTRPLELNQIHCGDCRKLLPRVEPGTVRLIHTSPPYNIGRPYNAYEDSRPVREYIAFIREVIEGCYRALQPGGSLFWQTGYTSDSDSAEFIYPVDHLTFDTFLEAGFRLKDRLIWRYYGGMAFKRKFTNKHETILWWVKPGAEVHFDVFPVREKSKEYDARNNLFGRNPGNVWEVDRVAYGSTEQTSHIAVFPEEISDRIVLAASNEGDICLDPFSGSGTFSKMAKSRGRRFIGFEIDPGYVTESKARLDFCQDNEFDNVLSQIIKGNIFQGKTKSLRSSDIAEDLTRILHMPGRIGTQLQADENQLDALRNFRENGLTKSDKTTLWKSLDAFFAGNGTTAPFGIVDAGYTGFFKLHRVYNGVMRMALALRWLDAFNRIGAEDLTAHLAAVARNEPGSYTLRGESVTLKSAARIVRNGKPGKSPKPDAGEGRLELELKWE